MPAAGDFDVVTDDVAEALGQADFVSLLIPGVPANAHFINRERLALFQPHAWLINTARGAVVDESCALRRAGRRSGSAARRSTSSTASRISPVDPQPRSAHAAERHPDAARRQHDAGSQPRHGRTRGAEHRAGPRTKAFAQMDLLNPDVLAKTP